MLQQLDMRRRDRAGDEEVTLRGLAKLTAVDPIDLPHVDGPARVVHPDEPLGLLRVAAEKAAVLLGVRLSAIP